MHQTIKYFQQILQTVFSHYFNQENEETESGSKSSIAAFSLLPLHLLPDNIEPGIEEQIVLLLALMPHISPATLDWFFIQNKKLDRPYTEFGGCKGVSHDGFLPTGQTAAFLLTQLAKTMKNGESKAESEKNTLNGLTPDVVSQPPILSLFSKDHWFYRNNILHLEGQGEGEPFLSGRLVVSEEFLVKVLQNGKYEPEYSTNFPAKRISTPLDWNDLVLPCNLREELDDIVRWIQHHQQIRASWRLDRIIRPGYRCLFYGEPGTGKTLTATLLGKQNKMDVYRVDLSMIVSKYIGETEKNLAKVFDKAEYQNWILFFDEADALFGQRTETQSSNDRHANQEVAYLLQRIEDFPGMVILATNLKENIDEAFFRRFQSALYFPMPDRRLRFQLWKNMLPAEWLGNGTDNLLHLAAEHKLSGGSIVNVIQNCAIKLFGKNPPQLTEDLLKQALAREQVKEGKIIG